MRHTNTTTGEDTQSSGHRVYGERAEFKRQELSFGTSGCWYCPASLWNPHSQQLRLHPHYTRDTKSDTRNKPKGAGLCVRKVMHTVRCKRTHTPYSCICVCARVLVCAVTKGGWGS